MEITIINKHGEHHVCEKLVLIPNDSRGYVQVFGSFDIVPNTEFYLAKGDKLIINGVTFPFES